MEHDSRLVLGQHLIDAVLVGDVGDDRVDAQ
jgi:hypothetical protein